MHKVQIRGAALSALVCICLLLGEEHLFLVLIFTLQLNKNSTLVNLYFVDLTLFGLALGQTTNSVTLNLIQAPFFGTSDPMEVVAINSSVVPVPAAVWLFGTGIIGLIGFSKRRKVS
ncbi:MAG: PEP-CTERM sorting domain-containing protein [Gammaproteobacteria bacterium]|nr:PEP-CTERM sorting domain-containing protein [Gammaproteobacteria bacterium]